MSVICSHFISSACEDEDISIEATRKLDAMVQLVIGSKVIRQTFADPKDIRDNPKPERDSPTDEEVRRCNCTIDGHDYEIDPSNNADECDLARIRCKRLSPTGCICGACTS
jgi:hypothetical protein